MKKAIIALSLFTVLASCHANYDKAPSGLIYKIFPGKGGTKVATAKFVKFNYEFTIKKNGKDSVLNTTYGKFPQFAPVDTAESKIAYSYMEVMLKCNVGDSAEFSMSVDTLRARNPNMPPAFAKGDFIKGRIKILAAFASMEEGRADYEKEMTIAQNKAMIERQKEVGAQDSVIAAYLAKNNISAQKTINGAFVLVQNPGTGVKADTGKQAFVKYRGYLLDGGKVFDTNMDSSKGHTDPIPVAVGAHRVIPGWEECLPYFGKGGKGKLYIPAALGYGSQGSGEIPPNASLVFEIEIVDVKDAPLQTQQPGQMPQRRLMTAPQAKPAH